MVTQRERESESERERERDRANEGSKSERRVSREYFIIVERVFETTKSTKKKKKKERDIYTARHVRR